MRQWKFGVSCLLLPYAILEIKSRRIVQGRLSVIGIKARSSQSVGSLTDTRQTRSALGRRSIRTGYAFNIGVKDFVPIDEGSAIYFRFTSDSPDPGSIMYLVAHPYSNPTLSQGEIILFLNYRALTTSNIVQRNFSNPATTDYEELSERNRTPQSGNRLVQPKRQQPETKPSASGQFHGFQLNANITLELLTALPLTAKHHRTGSRDSGFHESTTQPCPFQSPLTTGAPRAEFLDKHLITRNVAILTSSYAFHLSSVIAKLPHMPTRYAAEIAAYAALLPLQGGLIPHFYGAAHINSQPPNGTTILLIELITPGTSIEALGNMEQWERIDALRQPEIAALDIVHAAGVVHQDAYGRNFLVTQDGEGVMLVDLDLASSHVGNPKRWKMEKVADRVFLKEAFWVPESTGKEE